MMWNYRIVLSEIHPRYAPHEAGIHHGWCYFGFGKDENGQPRTMETALLAAMLAARVWDGYDKPLGFDKEAF